MYGRVGDFGLPSDPLEVPRPVLSNALDNSEIGLVESRDHTVDLFEVLSDYRRGQV